MSELLYMILYSLIGVTLAFGIYTAIENLRKN